MKLTLVTDSIFLGDEVRDKIQDFVEALEMAEEEIKNNLNILVYHKKEENKSSHIFVNFTEPLTFKALATIYSFLDKTFSDKVLFYFPNVFESIENIKLTILLEDTFIENETVNDIKLYKADAYKEIKHKEYLDMFNKLSDRPSFDDWFDCNLDALFVESGTIIISSGGL